MPFPERLSQDSRDYEKSRTQMQPTLTLEKGSEGSAGATVHFRWQMYLKWLWSGNTDYHVKALAVQVWLLSSTPGTHVKIKKKQSPQVVL